MIRSVSTYRYLLRPEGAKVEVGGYSRDDLGIYESDEVFHKAPVGLRVRSDRGGEYIVKGQLNRDVPDLVRGVLFVSPAD
jgi:hypothetical protein